MEDNFSIAGVGWEALVSAHLRFKHIYYALYFCYYCIVINKEMIIRYTINAKAVNPELVFMQLVHACTVVSRLSLQPQGL